MSWKLPAKEPEERIYGQECWSSAVVAGASLLFGDSPAHGWIIPWLNLDTPHFKIRAAMSLPALMTVRSLH